MADNKPPTKTELAELAIVLAAALSPLFLLAHEVDSDEFIKAGSGVFLASTTAAVFAGYRLWKGKPILSDMSQVAKRLKNKD